MRKIAFLFPGQGSQYPGMAGSFFPFHPQTKLTLRRASQILGFNIKKICLKGPAEKLRRTIYAQPALLTVEWITTQILENSGITPAVVAGHSLGEYAALAAARIADFSEILRLVQKRAQLMEEVSQSLQGGMLAVIGLTREKVVSLCREIEGVTAANFNSPFQIVISGKEKHLERAAQTFKERGARRVVPLRVSGPFHTTLMSQTAHKFSKILDQIQFSPPRYPIVPNSTAIYTFTAEEVKEALKKQMDQPVLWEDSVRAMISRGIELFIEVGPGKVLQGLVRKIDRSAAVVGIETPEDLAAVLQLIRTGDQALT